MPEAVTEAFQDSMGQLYQLAPIAAVALSFALYLGFFRFSHPQVARNMEVPKLWQVLVAFLLYVTIQFGIAAVGLYVVQHYAPGSPGTTVLAKASVSLVAVIASAIGVVLYVLTAWQGKLRQLWTGGKSAMEQMRAFGVGIGSWLLAFPLVMFLAHFLALAILYGTHQIPEDQVAVEFYNNMQGHPLLLLVSSLLIGLIVPIVEEILFRMLIQSAIRRKLSPWPAIIISSLIFSVFHFAEQQGVGNVQVVVSIFCLSLFLGILYEKWGTLWAPIGLHAAFNSASMLMVSFSQG